MSLLTYEDARPYARAIFEEVRDGHMPPWHADAPDGTFSNERKLTAAREGHSCPAGPTAARRKAPRRCRPRRRMQTAGSSARRTRPSR
jgi:hypothetical protein